MCLHCAERWLTPGTEYAVTEKLPLPKDWYTDMETEAIAPGATNLMSTASLPANYEYDESSMFPAHHVHMAILCPVAWRPYRLERRSRLLLMCEYNSECMLAQRSRTI